MNSMVNIRSVFDDIINVLAQSLGNANLQIYRKDQKISVSVPGIISCFCSQCIALSESTLSPGELPWY